MPQNTGYSRGVLSTLDEQRTRPQRSAEFAATMRLPSNIRSLVQNAMIGDPSIQGLGTRAQALVDEFQDPYVRLAHRGQSVDDYVRAGLGTFAANLEQQRQRQDAEHQHTLAVMERQRQEAAHAANPMTVGSVNGQQVYIPAYGQAARFQDAVMGQRQAAAAQGISSNIRGDAPVLASDLDQLHYSTVQAETAKANHQAQLAHQRALELQGLENQGKVDAELAKTTVTSGNKSAEQTAKDAKAREKAMNDYAGSTYGTYRSAFRNAISGSRVKVYSVRKTGKPYPNDTERVSEYAPATVDNQEIALKQARIPYVRQGNQLIELDPDQFRSSPYFQGLARAKFGDTGAAVQQGLEGNASPWTPLTAMLSSLFNGGQAPQAQAQPPVQGGIGLTVNPASAASTDPALQARRRAPSLASRGTAGASAPPAPARAAGGPQGGSGGVQVDQLVTALGEFTPGTPDHEAKVKAAVAKLQAQDPRAAAQFQAAARQRGFRV